MIISNFKIFTFLFVFIFTNIAAEEKKIKTRGTSESQQFKKIEINISPDLLNLEELKKLKNSLIIANNYAIEIDKTLDVKKKIKFRGSAKQIYKNYSNLWKIRSEMK